MSISNIQYNKKKEQAKQELLKQGIEPNNYELNSLMNSYMDNHILGMPSYSPIQQEAYGESSKESYNHNFKTLGEDLQVIYDANVKANNKSVAMQEYYDTEKVKIMNSIQKLSLRVDNIIDIMNSSITGEQYVQSFDDLYEIEFYGDASRNIPYTTSFVDLLQNKVYTDKANYKINKKNIINSDISIEGLNHFDSYETDGTITDILTDTINNNYIISGKSLDNATIEIAVKIDFKKLVEINTVILKFTSSRALNASLSLSEDGENFVPVHDITGDNLIEWNFPSKQVQYIQISITKDEADGYKDMFEYYYIIKNISVALNVFNSKSILVSKVIEFDNLVNSICLNAQSRIYNNTRIDYFIGFDNGVDKIGWDNISNNKEHELFMFEKKNKILNYHLETIDDFGDMVVEAEELYKICDIPLGTNKNRINITPGYNMWSVIMYQKSDNQEYDESFTFNSFDFTEYTDQCTSSQLFMDCENYDNFQLYPNTLYVFTQYVSLDSPKNIYNKRIDIMDSSSSNVLKSTEKRVFINGLDSSPIGEENDLKYSFNLKKGVNKIQIVVYAPAKQGAGTARWLHHNLNFKELTNDVFAYPPMKYVDWYTLDKQMKPNYQYYTIKNNTICVKCSPEDMIKSNIEDMGYFMTYYSLKKEMAHYFNNHKLSFRIMAVLNSDDNNVSPELINFRIIGR